MSRPTTGRLRAGVVLAAVPLLVAAPTLPAASAHAGPAASPTSATAGVVFTRVEAGPTSIGAETPFLVTVVGGGTRAVGGTVSLSTPDGRLDLEVPVDGRTAAFRLTPGTYADVEISYSGWFDLGTFDSYAPSSGTTRIDVAPASLEHATDLPPGVVLEQDAPFALGVTPVSSAPHLRPNGHYVLLAFDEDDRRYDLASGDFDTDRQLAFDASLLTREAHTYRIYFQTASHPDRPWFAPRDTLLGTVTVVPDRVPTTTSITTTSTVRGGTVDVRVGATGSAAGGSGTVTVSAGSRTLGTTTVTRGSGVFRLPADLAPGTHVLTASYAGSTTHTPSDSQPTAVRVVAPAVPATSRVTGTVRRTGRTLRVTATVVSSRPVTGRVQVLDGRRVVRALSLGAGARGRLSATLRGLKPGRHVITVRYLGSREVRASSRAFRVTVPRR
jgi:hypothetical protein